MSTVYDWGRLTREEIEAFAATALTVIPVGTTEQHGPHLATCTDALLAETLALRAAEAATARRSSCSPRRSRMGPRTTTFPSVAPSPSMWTRCSACSLTCSRRPQHQAAQRVFVVNAHGGNAAACVTAVTEASRHHGIVAATALIADLLEPDEVEGPLRGHAAASRRRSCSSSIPIAFVPTGRDHHQGGAARDRQRGLVIAEPGRWLELDGFTDRKRTRHRS